MATTLELVLLYLVAAVLGVVVCRSLKLPPMLGYLVVGVLIGPNALALAKDTAGVKYLAEFGVVFLMFVIGLDFNLPKLRSMRTQVFGLGLAQVVLTIAVTLLGHFLLVFAYSAVLGKAWQMPWQGAVVLGSALAMSSTAIVVKLMAERLELESEHGKRVMGSLKKQKGTRSKVQSIKLFMRNFRIQQIKRRLSRNFRNQKYTEEIQAMQ